MKKTFKKLLFPIYFILAIITIPLDMLGNVSAYPIIWLFKKKWYGVGFSEEDLYTPGYLSNYFLAKAIFKV